MKETELESIKSSDIVQEKPLDPTLKINEFFTSQTINKSTITSQARVLKIMQRNSPLGLLTKDGEEGGGGVNKDLCWGGGGAGGGGESFERVAKAQVIGGKGVAAPFI